MADNSDDDDEFPFKDCKDSYDYFIKNKMRCNLEQYRLLKKCSEAKNISEWNDWRKKNRTEIIYLQGADFEGCFLEGAHFFYAKLQGVRFWRTNCQKAHFMEAKCQKASFWDAKCQGAKFVVAKLQKAFFIQAHCEDASFTGAKCQNAEFNEAFYQGANFSGAKCQGANFTQAECQGANFNGAECQGVNFSGAHLETDEEKTNQKPTPNSAKTPNTNLDDTEKVKRKYTNKPTSFTAAIFDNATDFSDCHIDENTDFSSSSLDSVLIDPNRRALLERNIRQKHWEAWYDENKANKIITPFMRFFWYLSNYGYSSKNILWLFVNSILFFACVYTLFPNLLEIGDNNSVKDLNFFQMVMFATSTMVTLGFSNINVATNASTANAIGMLVVTTNLMMGYFILAVFVTRIGIMFQSLGPGQKIKTKKINKLEVHVRIILYWAVVYCLCLCFFS